MRTAIIAALAAFPFAATAGMEFGSTDEAVEITEAMLAIIDEGGVDAGIAAMHDSSLPFASSKMGVHVFEGGIIVADNREPELIATSYHDLSDLTEELMWPRIEAAAEAGGEDLVLKWYHYDTEEVYDYHCFSKWATAGEVLVMVCR